MLAVEPAVVVGTRAGKRGGEHPLGPEPDRDGDRMPRRHRRGAEPAAELPGAVEGEAAAPQFGAVGDDAAENVVAVALVRGSTLIARPSSRAASASTASPNGSSRSYPSPGSIAPESTSGSSSSMDPRTAAMPPFTPTLQL